MGIKQNIKKIIPKEIKYRIKFILNRIKFRSLIKRVHIHYDEVVEKIKNREDRPIRFAAFVVFDSTFGAESLFALMQCDTLFDSKIVIIPDISRGEEHMLRQYNSTKEFFAKKYGKDNVIDGYDIENRIFKDVSDDFDIIYFANPYDIMVHEFHGIEHVINKNVLPIYIPYSFQPDKYSRNVMGQLNMSLCWKIFADTEYSMNEYRKYSLNYGKNVVLAGYAKMDMLENVQKVTTNNRKKIIIAPHHTITTNILPLSNFLRMKDYILTLPIRFPSVDFIFRPHPLLFTTMINEGFWTFEDKELYIQKLKENGVECSFGGNYFDLFAKSDAIIHDCSSYIVEYLFVDKPCCFVVKNNVKKILLKLGIECLKCYTIAKTERDVDNFILSVCSSTLKDNDKKRKNVMAKIKVNYPNSSKKIYEELKKISNSN